MIDKNQEKLFTELSETNGISGHEKAIAKIVMRELEGVADKIEHDNLGSVIATLNGEEGQPKIMLAAHMDEVGFIVKSICPNGMIRIHPVGGWYNHVILAENFIVTTRDGKEYFAVTGAEPPHGMSAEQRSRLLPISEMYLDLGVKDAEMVKNLGIKVGDTVTPYEKYRVMADGETLLGKAWDDRIGVAIGLEVMKRLKKEGCKANLVFAATVQEEVGCRGAQTSANYVKPDVAFAVDVSTSNDLPHSPVDGMFLGCGPAISVMDGGTIAHTGLFEFVENLANENKIPLAYDMETAGGTDASRIHMTNDGVITLTVSLACRYYHSHVSMINYNDYVNAVELLVKTIKSLDKEALIALKESKYM